MANSWFRLYHEFATDPKVQMLSEVDQRRYIMLLCLKCVNGDVTLHETEVAFQLRISNEELSATMQALLAKGLVDEAFQPTTWDKRQYISDGSYGRVKRHREKRSAMGLPQQNSIPKATRKAVYERDGYTCIYCGTTEDLTLDHDLPQSRGGTDDEDNLVTACRACNAAKRDLTHSEYCDRNGLVTLQKRPQTQKQTQITDTEKNKNTRRFKPPELAEVREAITAMGYRYSVAEDFVNFYGSKNWMVGKNKMADWHKALGGWEARKKSDNAPVRLKSVDYGI